MDETPAMRIGDADRHQVVDLLRSAVTEGRITLDEFEERSGEAYKARTRGELDVLLADLPPGVRPQPAPAPRPALGGVPAGRPAGPIGPGGPVVPAGPGGPGGVPGRPFKRRFVGIMSGARARGRWHVPPVVNAFAFWGGVVIDLRDAVIETPVVVVKAVAIMGGVEVIVPEGYPVDLDGFVLMGGTPDTTRAAPPVEGAPLIRIKAAGMWGSVGVRNPSRRSAKRAAGRHGHGHGHGRGDDRRPEPDPPAGLPPSFDDRLPEMPGRRAEPVGVERRPAAPAPTPPAKPAAPPAAPAPAGPSGPATPAQPAGPPAPPVPPVPATPPGAPPVPAAPAPPPAPVPATPAAASANGGSRAAPAPAAAKAPAAPAASPTPTPTSANGAEPAAAAAAPQDARSVFAGDGDPVGGTQVRPTGRVLTMLVSDICDSTLAVARLGDQRWMGVLAAHNALVREQLQRYHGTEVKHQGDGFLVTFTSARQAVLAGIAIQRAMAAHRRAYPDNDLHVRLGVHTGEVVEEDGDIFGQNVVVSVRIADVARPDEVLVSGLTRDLTESSGDLRFDAGREATLKGLSRPSRVYAAAWS